MSGEIKKILVMGAGVMGATMAQVYAAGGYETVVADTAPEALERARKRIEFLVTDLSGFVTGNIVEVTGGTTFKQ